MQTDCECHILQKKKKINAKIRFSDEERSPLRIQETSVEFMSLSYRVAKICFIINLKNTPKTLFSIMTSTLFYLKV